MSSALPYISVVSALVYNGSNKLRINFDNTLLTANIAVLENNSLYFLIIIEVLFSLSPLHLCFYTPKSYH